MNNDKSVDPLPAIIKEIRNWIHDYKYNPLLPAPVLMKRLEKICEKYEVKI